MGRKKKRKKPERPQVIESKPAKKPRRMVFVAVLLVMAALAVLIGTVLQEGLRDSDSPTPFVEPPAPPHDVEPPPPTPIVEPQDLAFAAYAGSSSCRECHTAAHDDWSISHHALAEQPTTQPLDNPPLDQHPDLREPQRIIGYNPLQQFLIAFDGGRYQAHDTAYDPRNREWFNVFGDENRQPGEWGHWTGRGLNWNSMCAACHNTRLYKNYDLATDTYNTRMAEMSIGCESCHGPMKDHVDWQRRHPERNQWGLPLLDDPSLKPMDRDAVFDTCAACHSRRSELTGDFKPGDSYHDHYLLSTVDYSDVFYPDGQVRDEDFEVAAFLGSRMHAAGVRCVDCHNAHTAKPVATGDFMCMRCHQGIDTWPTAVVIRPDAHTFHAPDSEGSRCVNCHMPQTTYMQRHVRHDHGFTIPDPLLTIEHGIPNACNRCHTDQSPEWSLRYVQEWYGQKMDRPSRQRARAIARARDGDTDATQHLLELLADETQTPYWRAVVAGMLAPFAADPSVTAALLAHTRHAHPLVRASAARSLEPLVETSTDVRSAMQSLLNDERRNVRLAAAWALRATIDPASLAGRELLHLLEVNADQPLGRLQRAHYQLTKDNLREALRELSTAVQWDPTSPGMRREMAVLYSIAGNPHAAVMELRQAVRLAPEDAEHRFLLGLALHENGELRAATTELAEAARLEPSHARAWYNLGLAQHALGDSPAALESLTKAESADPTDPAIPYARAIILLQLNRTAEARDAARRSLAINPQYTPALQLLRDTAH